MFKGVGKYLVNHFKRTMRSEKGQFPWGMIIGGALSGLSASGALGGKEGSYEKDPYGALTPEQRALMGDLSSYFHSRVGKPGELYGGQFAAEMTPAEREVLEQQARMGALGERGLTSALQGEFPEEYFQQNVYNPALKQWREDIQPGLEESYAGPSGGGYWGSARAGAVAKGARDIYDKLIGERSNLAWQAQQNIPNAISAANSLSTTGAAIQSLPRLIRQYGLDQMYNDWVRAQGANKDAIDQALNFMNISAGTNTYSPAKPSVLGSIAGALGSGLMYSSAMRNANQGTTTGTTASTTASPSRLGNFMVPAYEDYRNQSLAQMDWRNRVNALGGNRWSYPTT